MDELSAHWDRCDGERPDGLVRGMQSALLLLGRKQLGEPDRDSVSALEAITDPYQLDRLGDRLAEAISWQELLRMP